MSPTARPKTDRKSRTAPRALVRDTANDSTRVSESDIALKAFAYYCERGGEHGSDVEDWLRAERELLGTGKTPKRRTARSGTGS